MYNFTQSVKFYTQCIILHKVYNFTCTQCIYFTYNLICEFELPDASLRCFFVRQILSCIYAISSVKFSGLHLLHLLHLFHLIYLLHFTRVTSVKSPVGIITHQRHISQVSANDHSLTQSVTNWPTSLLERLVTLKREKPLAIF